MLGETVEVLLLLGKLLLEIEELLLLALADGIVLAGLFAALESIASVLVSYHAYWTMASRLSVLTLGHPYGEEHRYLPHPWRE